MPLNFEVNVFRDLIQKYSNWENLKSYLESEEGGLFRIADKNDNGLCLIRYEKGTSKMDLPHSRWFRSVVWNTVTNRPVCVAPPKATSTDFSFTSFKEISDAGVVCQELLDGFMINCFRTQGDESLHIASRSKLDAAGKFYSQQSFRELFMEAYMNTTDCPHYGERVIQDNSRDISHPDSSKGEVSTFYSFLVQHGKHRIVKPLEKNRVYLIHKGIVYEDGRVAFEDSPEKVKERDNIDNIPMGPVKAKGSYAQVAAKGAAEVEGDNEVQKWIKNQLYERDWSFHGLVFKDAQGNRWRFRSEKYAAVKALRGNSATYTERFAQLYTQNLVQKYLEYYPEDVMFMALHTMCMDVIVKKLYDCYVDLHITKVKKADEIEKMYLPHLYSIHGIYLSQLRPNHKKVDFNEIRIYLHKQPWQRIVFLLKNNLAATS
jgi:hypothetical protein